MAIVIHDDDDGDKSKAILAHLREAEQTQTRRYYQQHCTACVRTIRRRSRKNVQLILALDDVQHGAGLPHKVSLRT